VSIEPNTGAFVQTLALGGLADGPHTLTVTTTDAAGNTATEGIDLQVDLDVPFAVTGHNPLDGAVDFGVTSRPQGFLSRAVAPSSPNDPNSYAPVAGQKLPPRIAPASDGTFAWLFFNDPLPDAARIEMTVDGSTIRAQDGGPVLDADADGTPGGVFTF